MYDRTTVQGATLTCVVNCTAGTPMPRLCPVLQWSVHWTPSRTTRVLVLAGARRCALETCEKKNMWAPLLGLAKSIYYITYHLQSNWNTRKENWCKIKEMDCRRKHKCQQQCQLRMIPTPPVKSCHFIPMSPWQLSKIVTVKTLICCYS